MKDYGIVKADQQELLRPTDEAPNSQSFFEMDVQIRSAREHVRDLAKAMDECKQLVEIDKEFASRLEYRLERFDKRTGKTKVIAGPSINCARMVAQSLGNIRWAGNVVEVGKTKVVAEGLAIDLERNTAARITVSRPIVGKNGQRYSADMIEVTSMAAQSIAMRNAILNVVPEAFVKKVLDHAKATTAKTPAKTRLAKALEWARSEGLRDDEVARYLGVDSLANVTDQQVDMLAGAANAIMDGETSVDDVFRRPWDAAKVESAEEVTSPSAPAETAPSPEGSAPTAEKPKGTQDGADTPLVLSTLALGVLGRKMHDKLWPSIEAAFTSDGVIDGNSVRAVLKAPKTILEACCLDKDPKSALVQIKEAVSK